MMFDPCNTYFPQATMKATLLETLLSNIFFSFCLRCFLYKKSCWSMTELAIALTETLGKHLSVATTGKAATQEVWYRSILNMLHTLGKGGCGNQSVSYWSQPLHHCSARTLWKVIFLVFSVLIMLEEKVIQGYSPRTRSYEEIITLKEENISCNSFRIC